MKKAVLLAIIPALFLAQANYKIQKDVISSGGTKMTAGNYVLHGTVSQTTIGSVTGGNYKGIIGFWQPFDWVDPRPPYIVKVTKSGNNVVLTWNKVTLDVNGYPEVIQYYSVYRDTLPNYTPGTASFLGNSTGPDTTYTNTASLDATRSYYYLVKAVDYGPNRSFSSNMGFKFNKFFNENAGPTSDRNWVSLPWHNNYTVVDDLVNDLSPTGDPLVVATNLRNDQFYEGYFWDPDFGWDGINFTVTSGRGYEMVTIKDSILYVVGANNPNGLVSLNENPGAVADRNWVSIPYNASYATINDLVTTYSPTGDPLVVATNLRNDQFYEGYFWDPDFGWDGVNFNIERGRGYEFVTINDTTWNPTEYSNEGGPIFAYASLKKDNVFRFNGNEVLSRRSPLWLQESDMYVPIDQARSESKVKRLYRDAGIPHIAFAHVNVKGYENIGFTAYRAKDPTDVLTEQIVGCGYALKGDEALVWFNAGNFRQPWNNGEEIIFMIEAVRGDQGFFNVLRFRLDMSVDLQDLTRDLDQPLCLIPIPEPRPASELSAIQEWLAVENPEVVGYSLYNNGVRLNSSVITETKYSANGLLVLKPIISGGYETFLGSHVETKPVSEKGIIPYAFQAAPNPFTRSTVVSYALPATRRIEVAVYDISGRLVKTLVTGYAKAGYYSVKWNGDDNNSRSVAGGIYFLRMSTSDFNSQQKIVYAR